MESARKFFLELYRIRTKTEMSDFTGLMPAAVVPAVLETAQPKRKAEDEVRADSELAPVAGTANGDAPVVAEAAPAVAGTPATVSEASCTPCAPLPRR